MNDNVSNGSSFPISENVEKGNYLKVRTYLCGYTFKKLPAIPDIEKIRLYAQIFNAFVFTKYTDLTLKFQLTVTVTLLLVLTGTQLLRQGHIPLGLMFHF